MYNSPLYSIVLKFIQATIQIKTLSGWSHNINNNNNKIELLSFGFLGALLPIPVHHFDHHHQHRYSQLPIF